MYENGTWTAWETLTSRTLWSSVWQHARVDLSAYAGQRVRIGFYHTEDYEDKSGTWSTARSAGWYIDDVRTERRPTP